VGVSEVGENSIFRGRNEAPRQVGIDTGDDLGRRAQAVGDGRKDLGVALAAVADVRLDQTGRILDDGAVRRKQSRRPECTDPVERTQVLVEITAAARRDHDGSADADEVAAVDFALEDNSKM
jgi:hypothetical protein